MKIPTILFTFFLALTLWSCDNRVDLQNATLEEKLESLQKVMAEFPEMQAPMDVDPALVGEGGTDELDRMSEYHLSIYQQSIGHDLQYLEMAEAERGKMRIWIVGKVDFGNGTQFLITVEGFANSDEMVLAICGVSNGMVGEQLTAMYSFEKDQRCAILPGARVQTAKGREVWTGIWNPEKMTFEGENE